MFNQTEHYVYPFQSPAHEVRKVGNISSNNRGKQVTPRSGSQALYLRLAKSIAKSKNIEHSSLTKITLILKLHMNNV